MTIAEHYSPNTSNPTPDELVEIETGVPVSEFDDRPQHETSKIGRKVLHHIGEWGPEQHREDYTKPESDTPSGLSFSA